MLLIYEDPIYIIPPKT